MTKKKNKVGPIVGVDGIDYINVYSRGMTELGREASHFAYAHFVHPTQGGFYSMEAFWFYAKLQDPEGGQKEDADKLRKLYGYEAKQFGSSLASKHIPNFKELIISGNWHKFNQNSKLKQLMIESTLPFVHFYVVENGTVSIEPTGYEWLMDGLENIRKRLKLQAQVLGASG